jgi:hypothetical protein
MKTLLCGIAAVTALTVAGPAFAQGGSWGRFGANVASVNDSYAYYSPRTRGVTGAPIRTALTVPSAAAMATVMPSVIRDRSRAPAPLASCQTITVRTAASCRRPVEG